MSAIQNKLFLSTNSKNLRFKFLLPNFYNVNVPLTKSLDLSGNDSLLASVCLDSYINHGTLSLATLTFSYIGDCLRFTCGDRILGFWSLRFSRRCQFPNDSSLQQRIFSRSLLLLDWFDLFLLFLTNVAAVR